MRRMFIIGLMLALLTAGCASATTPTAAPDAAATAAALAATYIAQTAAAAPSATPLPPTATSTPPPPTATLTPTVTATPLPPTATQPPTATPTEDFLATHSRTLPPGKVSHIRVINHSGQGVHLLFYTSNWFTEFQLWDETTIEVPVATVYFYGYLDSGKYISNVAYVTDDIHTWVVHIYSDSAIVETP